MYPAISADAPVVVWLNGGPGASSTLANFVFHGPLRIAQDSQTGAFEMYTTNQTWINTATVIYIDQPVQTGFSYGTPLLTNMDEVTSEFINFLD